MTEHATAPASGGAADPAAIEDLVVASHILAAEGVLDGFGHVSIRHPRAPDRYFITRSLAPALVTVADIMEFDLDLRPVDQRGRKVFLECCIHGQIYKARPDVLAVVHSHSPTVIPFGITQVAMRPVFHMAGFLPHGVPVFEIRDTGGMTDILIRDNRLGHALAETLGHHTCALMRGHGNVVVGPSLQAAVYRAVYTEVNARLQAQAIALGGPITYLDPRESAVILGRKDANYDRPWAMWKRKVTGERA